MCVFSSGPPTPQIYPLSLHDALPILGEEQRRVEEEGHLVAVGGDLGPVALQALGVHAAATRRRRPRRCPASPRRARCPRSEEHTSELQSREKLVCRHLPEKKKRYTR